MRVPRLLRVAALATWWCLYAVTAGQSGVAEASQGAQTAASTAELARSGAASTLAPPVDAPPPPDAPAVISRDQSGRATIRAVRLDAPLRIDGNLDEPFYFTVLSISEFIQMEPHEGTNATEKTEVWLAFDRQQVYVSVRCWESQPERLIATEMRRDSPVIFREGQDAVGFMFDTFYDRRSGFIFNVNAIGGRTDGQFANERQYTGDWNPVWDVKVGRFDRGWTLEAAIPFKSLRYRPGAAQLWGFNVRRTNGWKNELSFITRMPAGRGTGATQLASLAATVVGLEAPSGSRNLEIKPYVVSNMTSARTSTPRLSNDVSSEAGVDVKYGLTQNLTADLTYNTDFAQVEADDQQVNLTRFSLFIPEKREFFLENQGTFAFGGAGAGAFASGASDTPILFYSRRIGLDEQRAVPIVGGGRLTGRVGRFSVGVLNIHAGREPVSQAPATASTVLRLKRDLLRKSSVGAIFTGRTAAGSAGDGQETVGVDGTFAFFENLAINTYWARTRTAARATDDSSYRGQLDYAGDRYGVQLEHLAVGDNFNPALGFLRRDDMRRSFGQFRFSPRPRAVPAVRKVSSVMSLTYIENGAGRVETRNADGELAIETQKGDRLAAGYADTYEFLPRPFDIAAGVTIPTGGYRFGTMRAGVTVAPQRLLSGTILAEHGAFYDGSKTSVALTRGRANLTPRLSVEPTLSLNRVRLAQGAFTTHLVGSRVTFTVSPLMFASALVQYNSSSRTLATNVRFRWEYHPGSELFVVYNEQRQDAGVMLGGLENRAIILKINRLWRP
jgi:hypothetical protein